MGSLFLSSKFNELHLVYRLSSVMLLCFALAYILYSYMFLAIFAQYQNSVSLSEQVRNETQELLDVHQNGIKVYSRQLVRGDMTIELLNQLFSKFSSVKVNSFEKFDTIRLGELFEHKIKISFEATYMQTLTMLKSIENFGSLVFWESIEYDATQYSKSKVVLVIGTLSKSKDWISVE